MCVLSQDEASQVQAIRKSFLPGEMHAVLTHKYYLSQKAGRDVGLDYAILDWGRRHATRWREERMRQDVEIQFFEIMKHKWIESQKAGCDLGREAIADWICKYAKDWRQKRERSKD